LYIMKKKYPVILTEAQREHLKSLIAAGTAPARKLTHARILLKADQSPEGPGWVDEQVADAVEVSQPTVARVRKQYFEEGLQAALNPDAHRRGSTTASWTASRRRVCWPWPAASHRRAEPAGVYDYWRISWSSSRSWRRSPTRRWGGFSKKHPQAAPEEAVVDPA
jgi:Homeodomain-like domain